MQNREELLNSVANDLVNLMNNYYTETDSSLSVEGLKFEMQKNSMTGEPEYIAYFNFGYSPAGEDLSEFAFYFDGTLEDLNSKLEDYSYDKEESVKNWLDAKAHGTAGVPDVDVLVEDAEVQEEFFNDLGRAFDGYDQVIESINPELAETLDMEPDERVFFNDCGIEVDDSLELIEKNVTPENIESMIDVFDEYAVSLKGEKHNYDVYKTELVDNIKNNNLSVEDFPKLSSVIKSLSDFSDEHFCEFKLPQFKLLSSLDHKNFNAVIKQIKSDNLKEISDSSLLELISAASQSNSYGMKH